MNHAATALSGGFTMYECPDHTHRLTLTHGLTHGANWRCRNGLALVCESVSLISHPKRIERNNITCMCACMRASASACVCARVCARACVRGLKLTHVSHRLTRSQELRFPPIPHHSARVASFAAVAIVVPPPHRVAHVATGAGARVAEAIGTPGRWLEGDGRGNDHQLRKTFLRKKNKPLRRIYEH